MAPTALVPELAMREGRLLAAPAATARPPNTIDPAVWGGNGRCVEEGCEGDEGKC